MRVEFRYATSADLLNWTRSRVLYTHDGSPACKNTAVATISYPSVLDPDSRDRNYGTVDDDAFLYFTRFNAASKCRMDLDRDLVRIPIKLSY